MDFETLKYLSNKLWICANQYIVSKAQDIWHMPNYSLISWVPKTGKNKKNPAREKKVITD